MDGHKPLILMVEDDEDMARFNSRLLTRNGYHTLTAKNVSEAKLIINENKPDLYVLDIGLPDGSGVELCKELRRESDAPVLFLTGRTGIKDKVAGLTSGGDYFLTKPYEKDEFLAVIKSLIRRAEHANKKISEVSVISRGPLTLRPTEGKAYVGERDAGLTKKEFAVLLLLVQNEDNEVSYEKIYENVWGSPMNNDSSSVRQQISRLKKKLGEENTDDFSIFNSHGKGYTLTFL